MRQATADSDKRMSETMHYVLTWLLGVPISVALMIAVLLF